MQWLNEPRTWTASDNTLVVTSDGQTDFWRRTHDGGIRDNGHFYFETVDGDFTVQVKQTANYRSQYDQAGLMVRADEQTWLKCGVEFVDGRHFASAVVTRNWSDWSVAPIENLQPFYIRCKREGSTLGIEYSLNGISYEVLRQAFLTDRSTLQVGMMLAAPQGNGFDVRFEDYRLATASGLKE